MNEKENNNDKLKEQFNLLERELETIRTIIEKAMLYEFNALAAVVSIIAIITALTGWLSYKVYTGKLNEIENEVATQQDHIEIALANEISRIDTALSKLEGKSFPDEGSIEVLGKGGYIGDGGIALIEFSLGRTESMNKKIAIITARISFKINVKGSAGTSVGIITTPPQAVIDTFTVFKNNTNTTLKLQLENGYISSFRRTIVEGYGFSGFFRISSQAIGCDIAKEKITELVSLDDLGIMSMQPILEKVGTTLKGEFKTKGIKGFVTDCDNLNSLLDTSEK